MVDDRNEITLNAAPGGRGGVLAKLSIPRTGKGVSRSRLHAIMDEARNAAAVWIVAPGGSGKTTLAVTYITERRLPCLWYQMDRDDADPATFFYYLGLAARQLQPENEICLPLLSPEHLHDIPSFSRRYFRQLFSLLPQNSVLVLDNYQELGGAEVMHEVVRNAIGEVPQGVNIIINSRIPPPPALARLQVTNALDVIGWEDLRLSYEETETIVRRSNRTLDEKIIRSLHARSEGWVAALALMLKHINKKSGEEQDIGLDSLERIFDYFAREFFDKLPTATRSLLMQTSLLSRVTYSMAEAVSGDKDAGRILAALHRQHFFTTRWDLSEITYQYHSLFREFLLARAAETYSREQYLALMRRVGRLLDERGCQEEAVALYLQSRAWEEAVALILAQAPAVLSQARAQIVAGWIQRLPKEIIMEAPWLLYWQGVSQQFTDPFAARKTLEQAYGGFVADGDVLGQLSTASAVVDIVFFLRESLLDTTPWIEVLQTHLETNPNFPAPMIEARILSSLFSVLMYIRPQDPRLPQYAQRLMVLLDADMEPNQRVTLGAHLVNYHAHVVGDVNTCERIVMRITPLLSAPQITAVTQLLWRSFAVLPLLLSGKGDDAYEVVRQLRALVKENNLPFMESIAIFYVVLVQLYRGELNNAQPLLERMTLIVNTSQPADVAWLYLAKCWYALGQGDLATANNQGRAALQAVTRVGATLTAMDVGCLMALERCYSGEYDEAFEYLTMPRKLQWNDNPRLHHQIALVEAYAHLSKGDRALCHDRLQLAFAIAARQHYYGTLYCWFPSRVMARLCSEALRAGIEVEYTRRLILQRDLLPEDLNIDEWPWRVGIHALGPFKLVINGKLHSVETKAQYKPIKLLKALVALGGKDVKEERLSEILWPDAEGDAAHSAFTTTLSRLRKLIGDKAITVKFGRISLNELYCWVDVWRFEDQINHWLAPGGDPEHLRTLAEKIAVLYQGPFMSDEEGGWSERPRQRLQAMYTRFISHCEHCERALHKEGLQVIPPFDPCGESYPDYPTPGFTFEELSAYTAPSIKNAKTEEDNEFS